jgi:RND family efflux transporter MFP subunit
MKPDFRQKKTRVIAAVVVLFLGYLGWQIYQRGFAGKRGQDQGQRGVSVAVEIAPVEKGTVREVAQFSGTLIPKASFMVAPKISGRLKQLLIDIGDRVSRGQLVAVIEDEEYQQELLQAEADLRVARANLEEAESSLEIAKKDLERARTLHQKGIQSDSQLDAVLSMHDAQLARHKVAQANLANREAALETAKVRLSYSQIRASWEKGSEVRYVGERFVDEGAMLTPNTPIISILELQPITAVVFVTEKDYFRLKTEQAAVVTSGAFPGEQFSGRVVRIAPLLKETTREARVEIEIQNPGGVLKPGLFINTEVEFGRREGATVVPVKALANREGRQGIFLADLANKKAVFQPVTVGIVEGERAEVVEPRLLSGHVVTLGHHLLEDGTNIILPATAPTPAAGNAQKPPAGTSTPPEVKR